MSKETATRKDHFIVFVPGFGGSLLRSKRTNKLAFIDFEDMPILKFWNLEQWFTDLVDELKYPNEVEPAGLVNEVVFLLPWAKQEHYGRLLTALERKMGYRVNPEKYSEAERNVYTFPYDWRQDNRKSARQLAEAVERWRKFHPGSEVWIIAHSNGGLVARWYIEKEDGKEHVGRLFLMGSPVDGAPKAMHIAFQGLDQFILQRFNLFGAQEKTRDLFRSFPSTYQLIPPVNPFLRDTNNVVVSPFTNNGWLTDPTHKGYLADAQLFYQELGLDTSVDTMVFFGRRKPTWSSGIVRQGWSGIDWIDKNLMETGDGTVPERSATALRNVQSLPFAATHGDIYVADPVIEILVWELVDKFGPTDRAALTTERLKIIFEPDRDVYAPGEEIKLRARITDKDDDSKPVSGATVGVEVKWRESLPGMGPTAAPPDSRTNLWEDENEEGTYLGKLAAPAAEGYYRVVASFDIQGEPALTLEELISVEAVVSKEELKPTPGE